MRQSGAAARITARQPCDGIADTTSSVLDAAPRRETAHRDRRRQRHVRQIDGVGAAPGNVGRQRRIARPQPHVVTDPRRDGPRAPCPSCPRREPRPGASCAAPSRRSVPDQSARRFDRCRNHEKRRRGGRRHHDRRRERRSRTAIGGSSAAARPTRPRRIGSAPRPRGTRRPPEPAPAAPAPQRRRTPSRHPCRPGTAATRDRRGRRSPPGRRPRPCVASDAGQPLGHQHARRALADVEQRDEHAGAQPRQPAATLVAPRLPLPDAPQIGRAAPAARRASANGTEPMPVSERGCCQDAHAAFKF